MAKSTHTTTRNLAATAFGAAVVARPKSVQAKAAPQAAARGLATLRFVVAWLISAVLALAGSAGLAVLGAGVQSNAPTATPPMLCFDPAGQPFVMIPLRDILALTPSTSTGGQAPATTAHGQAGSPESTPTRIPTRSPLPTASPTNLPETPPPLQTPSPPGGGPSPTPCGIGTGTVTAGSLFVRAGPGQGFASTGSLRLGQVVEIAELRGGWARLCGLGGWASAKYLKVVTR